jgi:arsenical pump membrane protein
MLAALIGGDLGPRLLPMGSLAGLLLLDLLRRQGVHITASQFIVVGLVLTLPTLILSLLLLIAMGACVTPG